MRAIWKGSISFGLVNIPIGLFPATRREDVSFRQLRGEDLSPIRYKRVAEADGEEVPWEKIVKGYEYEKGQFVIITDEDFDKAMPEATRRSFLPRMTLSILLVDDNRLNHEVAMGVFGPEGHRLAMARNGREAGAILERRACDIVLLNLNLPGENALETLAAIRRAEKEREKAVLVVGLTNDHSIAEREPTIKEITNGLLPTPIQPKDLSLLLDQFKAEWQFG